MTLRKKTLLVIVLLAVQGSTFTEALGLSSVQHKGWKILETDSGTRYAVLLDDLFRLEVREVTDRDGLPTAALFIRNRSEVDLALPLRRVSLRDPQGSLTAPVTRSEACPPTVVTVPARSSVERKIRFDSNWVMSRKGHNLTLSIDGLSISGEVLDLPVLKFTP